MLRIFGPPGTGKTTTLLNMVDDALLSGTSPNKIAFLAFTRKAANEAKERAAERFNLDPKDLPYFRTIHSLALSCSSIRAEQIMQASNYKEISHATGIQIGDARTADFEDDLPSVTTSKDPILGLINLARLRKVPLREQYDQSQIDIDWNTVAYIEKTLFSYKKRFNLYDFTDMLEIFIAEGERYCPDFDLCFVDEAQDLSPLQWDIAHILDDKSKRMYAAGDDDQAIYRWAGADVDHFINLPGGAETLSQSYRIPRDVHDLAEKVVRRIARRFPKRYEPKEERGHVARITTISSLDMSQGTWLVLSQAGYQLQPVAQELKSNGLLFNYRGHRSISEKVSEAVNGWEQLRRGERIYGDVARTIYSYMSVGDRIRKGFKKLPGINDDDMVSMANLRAMGGLLLEEDLIWSRAMDRLPETDRAYITALLRRGEKFNGAPRITLSTIHGAKGGEADNVVLFTDLSYAAATEMTRNADDMHRVFYVGVTRTKRRLFIVEPEDMERCYDL
jgi:DNA helicase II / ATP-dependent DNA helicase PcrA